MPRTIKAGNSNGVDPENLKRLDKRYTQLAEEMKILRQDMKEVLLEMKGGGYDVKIYRKASKIREIGYEEYRKGGDELDLYLHALGVIAEQEHEAAY